MNETKQVLAHTKRLTLIDINSVRLFKSITELIMLQISFSEEPKRERSRFHSLLENPLT